MSRFFVGGSSSEEESDNDNKSEEEENVVKAPARFAKGTGIDSSDEEDETPKKRVVKSTRDKRYDDLKETSQKFRNHMAINDWNAIHNDFEKLNKQLAKANTVIQKEGVPKFYVKLLVTLEDFVKTTQEKKSTVTMNATNTKSFNAMKQKLKKHNKGYEKDIEEFRKNPEKSDDEEAEDSEEDTAWMDEPDTDEEKEKDKEAEKPKTKVADGDDDSEEPSDEDRDSDSDVQDEPEDKSKKWMLKADDKKDKDAKDKKDKDAKEKDKTRGSGAKKVKKVSDEKKDASAEKKPIEMNPEEVKSKLKEILLQRGKRNTEPSKQIEKFNDLFQYAKSPEQQVEILIHLVSAQFDSNRSVATHMPVTLWKSCYTNLSKILTILEQNPSITLHEVEELAESQINNEDDTEVEQKQVTGNLVAFIDRLDDELTKSFQAIDPHTQEYVQRLGDENVLLELTERTQNYYTRKNKSRHAARVAAKRMEHIYYKLDAHHRTITPSAGSESESTSTTASSTNTTPITITTSTVIGLGTTTERDNKALLESLAALIMNHGDERLKARAMLMHIYYHALHDRFYEARDMMFMSHLQDSIIHMDIPTQILFNRTQVQIGLCAFRNNLIKNAYNCLAEVHAGGKVKELLAQGVTNTRYNDKSADQEKQERKRQLPFHMHINLELLEAVHLICAMLLEVPNMAAHAYDVKKKITSRFDRLLEIYERQVFTGPPENTRDVIISSSKNLSKGDWKKCEEQLLSLPVWALVYNSDQVKAMLRRKIQEEGLRTYLFTYSAYYKSMSLQQLSEMFELGKNTVHSIVSKMMISEELHASWDQPTGAIVMHGVEPTRLQYLAMQLSDKAAGFVELNERNLDPKGGNERGDRGDRGDRQNDRGGDRQGNYQKKPWQDRGDNNNKRENNNNRRGGDRNNNDRGDREDGGNRENRGGDRNNDRGDREWKDNSNNRNRGGGGGRGRGGNRNYNNNNNNNRSRNQQQQN